MGFSFSFVPSRLDQGYAKINTQILLQKLINCDFTQFHESSLQEIVTLTDLLVTILCQELENCHS